VNLSFGNYRWTLSLSPALNLPLYCCDGGGGIGGLSTTPSIVWTKACTREISTPIFPRLWASCMPRYIRVRPIINWWTLDGMVCPQRLEHSGPRNQSCQAYSVHFSPPAPSANICPSELSVLMADNGPGKPLKAGPGRRGSISPRDLSQLSYHNTAISC
ncbi:hypothetical protein HAX54_032633, partial [Datura stramonium]|nr:hypothetical protein [Datura stramonium]